MHTFDISPKDIETIVLSHGHFDHTTGLDGLARTLGRTNLPVMIHPDFWNRRRLVIPGRDHLEMPTTSKSALQGVGFEVIEERQPSFLLDNALLVTGEVDRTTAFERGMAGHQARADPAGPGLFAGGRSHGWPRRVDITGCPTLLFLILRPFWSI